MEGCEEQERKGRINRPTACVLDRTKLLFVSIVEHPSQFVGRFLLHRRDNVRVSVHREHDCRVSKPFSDNFRVLFRDQKQPTQFIRIRKG